VQPIAKGLTRSRGRDGRIVGQKADAVNLARLLCARREWSRGSTAEQPGKLPTFQLIIQSPASQGRIARYRIDENQSGGNGTVLLGLLLGQYS
jgi:hypothetical protein